MGIYNRDEVIADAITNQGLSLKQAEAHADNVLAWEADTGPNGAAACIARENNYPPQWDGTCSYDNDPKYTYPE